MVPPSQCPVRSLTPTLVLSILKGQRVSGPLPGRYSPRKQSTLPAVRLAASTGHPQCEWYSEELLLNTVNTRPDKAASLRCSWRDTPPSVNSNPCLMSSVCGNTDPKISVPMIASVLKSHTRMGNSVCSPTQERDHTERAPQDVNP